MSDMSDEQKDRFLRFLLEKWNELDLERLHIQEDTTHSVYSNQELERLKQISQDLEEISKEIEELDPPQSDLSAGWEC